MPGLASVWKEIRRDVRAAQERDPAARGVGSSEIVAIWPGVHAVLAHRVAHALWQAGARLPARAIAGAARAVTGIEIHPAAQVGSGLFIDHGMGVVIGETAEVGADVTLYHGVTLGGTSLEKGKRHPTIRDGVVVGAGAKVLGPIEVGECARIGANAVVVKPVPEDAVVVGVPGEVVARPHPSRAGWRPDLAHGDLPDVLGETLADLLARVHELETLLHAEPSAAARFTADGGVWHEAGDYSI
jgi:serine O-acetyltransferase